MLFRSEQVAALGGDVRYLWVPRNAKEPVLYFSTSVYRPCGEDSLIVAQRRVQNRNGNLTVSWRENPSTLAISRLNLASGEQEFLAEVSLLEEFGLSLEDSRILDFRSGKLSILGTVWSFNEITSGPNRSVAHQAIVQLDEVWAVESVTLPSIGFNTDPRRYEKNWMPHLGSSRISYTLGPRHVVDDLLSGERHESRGIPWDFGEPHGGTQWLPVGGSLVGLFHSSTTVESEGTTSPLYFIGAARIAGNPPYEVLEVTSEPLLVASASNPAVPGSSDVLFASGIAQHENQFLIGLGVNDAASALITVPQRVIYERLAPIP